MVCAVLPISLCVCGFNGVALIEVTIDCWRSGQGGEFLNK